MFLKQEEQTLDQKIWEFDFWVTPSIVDIRSTERFKLEMKRILAVLDALTEGGHKDIDENRYAGDLSERVLAHLATYDTKNISLLSIKEFCEEFMASLSALLFLVTGKSDNNNKCQFPVYLQAQAGWDSLPAIKSKGKNKILIQEKIPRIIDSESYMARFVRIYLASIDAAEPLEFFQAAARLLFQFISSLLGDEPSRNQLTAYLNYYSKSIESKVDPSAILTPLIIFQVRGSVAASGGHEPEEILRNKMTDWGMLRSIDFNTTDVILDSEAGAIFEERGEEQEKKKGKTKTRAYDFALPFRTPQWHPMIFVQSQFYAGDSGSVSHKNVDQTSSSRLKATALSKRVWPTSPSPTFLEYVDGAGYSASLNGDLKSLLSFDDTAGFFQIRSAPIRLRRELQKIGFLTPLEIAHSIFIFDGDINLVKNNLKNDGYDDDEITRSINCSLDNNFIENENGIFKVSPPFTSSARSHLLLDIVACNGSSFNKIIGVSGIVLVPGYGAHYGISITDLERIINMSFNKIWPTGFMIDLQELCLSGAAVLR